jgi:hypothetical protein
MFCQNFVILPSHIFTFQKTTSQLKNKSKQAAYRATMGLVAFVPSRFFNKGAAYAG